ncbi:hypothetical protein N7466_004359 [Penicillium verhagenii]|uniref:uncharacterized protein n=1 Tax=Penicillium verhagenii TaxID=1562060 RepID=UPI0025458369|nr:uncharacterized protein N7466_004359 [Penicillium verhagenii]KAJ5934812.1 hypothetical protein N7466_004359 [Penicillium verhagenii]
MQYAKRKTQNAKRYFSRIFSQKNQVIYRSDALSGALNTRSKLPQSSTSRRDQQTTLHRWLALWSTYGDFDWYHRQYHHDDAKLTCSCGRHKSPEPIALCH